MSENQIENQVSGIKTTGRNSRIYDIRDGVQKIEETNSAITDKSKKYLDQLVIMVNSGIGNVKNSIECSQKKIKDNSGIINMCKRLINNLQNGMKNLIGGLSSKNKKIDVDSRVSVIGEQKVSTDNKVSLAKLAKGIDVSTVKNRNSEQNEKGSDWILDKKAFSEQGNKSVNMKIENINKDSETMR